MDLFKKIGLQKRKVDKQKEEMKKSPLSPQHGEESLDLSILDEDFKIAKKQAMAQLSTIEQKIAERHKELGKSVKEKEDEKISLRMQIDIINRRMKKDKEKKEQELKDIQTQMKKALDELDEKLHDRIGEWQDRVTLKQRQLDEISSKNIFEEAQSKLEQENKEREIKTQTEELQNQIQIANRKFQEKQDIYSQQIKAREEEIIKLKTQLAIKEAQSRSEEEKYQETLREFKKKWESQSRALELMLNEKCEELKKEYQKKENELIAFRITAQQHESGLVLEYDSKTKELVILRDNLTDKMKRLEKEISKGSDKWQDELKVREEEYNQLKVQMMLKETEEKAGQEKSKQVLAEEEKRAEMQMKSIGQKINEMKGNYQNMITAKDHELESIKIQAGLKLESLHQQYEDKQAEIINCKNELVDQIRQLENKLSEEKQLWQQQIQVKADGIEKFNQERQVRHQVLQDEFERDIEELTAKRKSLDNELAGLAEINASEKDKWQKVIKEKDRELESLDKGIEKGQTTVNSKIEVLEKEMQKEQSPLITERNALENKINEQREFAQRTLVQKEQFIKSLSDEYAHEESGFQEKHNVQTQNIEQEEHNIERRINELKNKINEYVISMQSKLTQQENKIKELKSRVEIRGEEYNLLKEEKIKESEDTKKYLRGQISNFSGELAEIRTENEKIVKSKEQDKGILDKKIAEIEEQWNNKIERLNQNWAQQKMVLESEQKNITDKFAEEKLMWDKKTQGKEIELTELKDDITSREALHKEELAKLESDIAGERAFLEDKKKILTEEVDKCRTQAEDKLRVMDSGIQKLKGKIGQREIELNNITEERSNIIAKERARYSVQFNSIYKDIKIHEDQAKQVIKEKETQIVQLQKNFTESISNITLEKKKVENEWTELKSKLEKDIGVLGDKLSMSQQELPLKIKSKEDEIELFSGRISKYDVEINEKKKRMAQLLDAFQRRAKRKINQLQTQLADTETYRSEEIDNKEKELQGLISGYDAKKQELQAGLESDAAKFTEERYKLEKQKTEIESKVRNIEADFAEQINIKDKEIIKLREEITEKEISWQKERKKIQKRFLQERNMFARETGPLQYRLESERDIHEAELKKKEKQIEQFKTQTQAVFQRLSREHDYKINELDKTNKRLENSIAELVERYDKLKVSSGETQKVKLQELDALQKELGLKEIKFKDEQEKIQHENLEVSKRMQNEITESEQRIKVQLEKFNDLYGQKENEFLKYQSDAKSREEELHTRFARIESQIEVKKEDLTREFELLERKLKDGESKWSIEKQELKEQVERFNLEAAIKNTTFESERSKVKHDIKKGQIVLESEISDLKYKFDSDREYWNMKIHSKEEEINTFKIRIAARDKRIVSETERRKKELDKVISELQSEIAGLNKKYGQKESTYREEIELLQEQTIMLQNEIDRLKNAWEDQKKNYIRIKDNELVRLEDEIRNIQKSTAGVINNLEKIYKDKIYEISMLTENILFKDERLREEQEASQEFIRIMKNKVDAIRNRLKPKIAMNELIDEGIKAYDIGEYDKAIKIFTQLLAQDSTLDFAYQYLSMCYKNLGLKDNALEYAKKALELDPENELLKNLIEEL